MTDVPHISGTKAIRTYPTPDSPKLGTSPRNRALATFKYLLNLEPEQAKDHPLFKCIEHAFKQEGDARMDLAPGPLDDSFIKELAPGEIPLILRGPVTGDVLITEGRELDEGVVKKLLDEKG